MNRSLFILVTAVSMSLVACASTPNPGTSAPAPLPDARDLSENPLDVINLPQP